VADPATPAFTGTEDLATSYARTIFSELLRVQPSLRPVHHWVVDHRTWSIVRQIRGPGGLPLVDVVLDPDRDWAATGERVEWTLVGLPVLFDDRGTNLRLVCNGGVRSAGSRRCPSCGGTHG
jgi:hypothetical protein